MRCVIDIDVFSGRNVMLTEQRTPAFLSFVCKSVPSKLNYYRTGYYIYMPCQHNISPIRTIL